MFKDTLMLFTTTMGGNFISMLPLYTILNSFFLAKENGDIGLKSIGTGLTTIGMIGAAIGQGMVGYGACISIGRNPESAPKVTSTLIITAGFCESGAIYALVIAILLIFVA